MNPFLKHENFSRLTIRASCPMQLRNFPMDRQSCPLILGSCESIFYWKIWGRDFYLFPCQPQDAYTNKELQYQWQTNSSVNFEPNLALRYREVCANFSKLILVSFFFSQFDLISFRQQNLTFTRREGDFSTLQVSFNLQRHTGYFLIQVFTWWEFNISRWRWRFD